MKRMILFIALMFAFAISEAQTVTLAPWDANKTYNEWTTDYVLTNTTVRNFTLIAPQHEMCAQDFTTTLDSTSGNHTNVAVSLYGRKSAQTSTWTQIGSTVNWKGLHASAGADTTIIISSTAEVGFREFKWVYTGTGTGTSTIGDQEFKLYRGIP